jgi:hypothetical protein
MMGGLFSLLHTSTAIDASVPLFARWLTWANFCRSSFDLSTFLISSWKNFKSPLRKRPVPSMLERIFVITLQRSTTSHKILMITTCVRAGNGYFRSPIPLYARTHVV